MLSILFPMTRNCFLGVNMHELAADAATVNETIAESIRLNRKIGNLCNYVGLARSVITNPLSQLLSSAS